MKVSIGTDVEFGLRENPFTIKRVFMFHKPSLHKDNTHDSSLAHRNTVS